jgi:uncharacterized membrane protein
MRAGFVWATIAVSVALTSHAVTIVAAPTLLMSAAMKRVAALGHKDPGGWAFAPRITPDFRSIVRPSPDLAYGACVFDLSNGPLHVTANPSPNSDYMSVGVYAANTDNIASIDDLAAPQGIDFVLALPGQPVPPKAQVIRSPSDKGIILQRRIAPSAELFGEVDLARKDDRCEPVRSEPGTALSAK